MNSGQVGPWNAGVEASEPETVRLEVCQGSACREVGGEDLLSELERLSGQRRGRLEAGLCLLAGYCQGRCAIGPNVRLHNRDLSVAGPSDAAPLLGKARQLALKNASKRTEFGNGKLGHGF